MNISKLQNFKYAKATQKKGDHLLIPGLLLQPIRRIQDDELIWEVGGALLQDPFDVSLDMVRNWSLTFGSRGLVNM